MNKNVRFDDNRKKSNPAYARNSATRSSRGDYPRRAYRSPSGLKWAWVIVVLIAAGFYAAERYDVGNRFVVAVTAPKVDTLTATFPFCGDGRRITCIVDGDTFWLSEEKIRITDIDTPELSPPRCEAERVEGEAAKRRLRELLNTGPFSLVAGFRDEDRYGRKLRTVTGEGHSIGDILIQEGLARRWDGTRHPWCP